MGTVIKLKIRVEISRVHVKLGYCGACNSSAGDVDGQINPRAGWPVYLQQWVPCSGRDLLSENELESNRTK